MLYEDEYQAAFDFIKNHRCKKKSPRNKMTIEVSWASGIGHAYDVVCPVCKKSKDITDYDMW